MVAKLANISIPVISMECYTTETQNPQSLELCGF
jgi:hypothetical protein